MYFDAVLDFDLRPLFNGTPEETREFLLKQDKVFQSRVRVCVGYSMWIVPVEEYLNESSLAGKTGVIMRPPTERLTMTPKLMKFLAKGAIGLAFSAAIGYTIKLEKKVEGAIDEHYENKDN